MALDAALACNSFVRLNTSLAQVQAAMASAAGIPPAVLAPAGLFAGGGDFDLAVGTVSGYRTWVIPPSLLADDIFLRTDLLATRDAVTAGMLKGATGMYWWHGGVNEAACNYAGNHQPPLEGCGCGFWAYWEPQPVYSGLRGVRVIGAVEGWGRTFTGSRGFRCQQARIVALHVPPEEVSRPMLARACRALGLTAVPRTREDYRRITGRSPTGERAAAPAMLGDELARIVDEEAAACVTEIESALAQCYPEAEICATQKYMVMKHPPSGRP